VNILHVCANPKPMGESVSKQLAAAFFSKLIERQPDAEIVNLDLYEEKPPYYSYPLFRSLWGPVVDADYAPTKEEETARHYAVRQAELFNKTDVLVLTMPMWNFSAPAIMKAWMDQVLSPGLTFEMSAGGVRPLHKIKTLVLLAASGGVYKEEDARDALTPDIRAAFGFIGIDDVQIAWADGQNPIFNNDSAERLRFAVESAEEIAEELAEG